MLQSRPWVLRYGAAIAAVAAATVLRLPIDHLLGDRIPFITFFPAVMFAAWYGGLGPGLLALALSAVTAAGLFIAPRGSLAIVEVQDQVGIGLFLLVGIVCALLGEALDQARRRANTATAEALARQTELDVEAEARRAAAERLQEQHEALRRGEERLHIALDAGRMGTWDWHIPTDRVALSPALQRLRGLPADTFAGTFAAFQQGIHPDDRERVLGSVKAALNGGQPHQMEYRVVWPDGTAHWVEARGQLFWDQAGRPVRMLGVCVDIDERKRSELSFQFLADASASLAALVDYRTALQKVADLAVPHFADWCAVDMVGEDGQIRRLAVAHMDPAKVALAEEIDRRFPADPNAPAGPPAVLRSGKSERVAEITDEMLVRGVLDPEHLRLLRQLAPRSYMGVPLRARNRVLGVIIFVSAESGRRYTEADLTFAEELARRAAIAIENAELYAQLREADRRKDEFLATLAHELRNPLSPIANAVSVMQRVGVDQPQLRWARDIINRQLQHMTRLVDDLLDVSRISRGKIELRSEALDLSNVVRRAVETVRPLLDERRHELTVELPAQELPVCGDPVRLEQILANLLNNACKYTEPGGRIGVIARRNGDWIEIRVRDSGVGIAPERLPHLFEMFVQAEPGRTHEQGGLGIGLSLVRRLVEKHGGTVVAHSEGAGCGSEFVVRLPRLAQVENPPPPEHVNGTAVVRTMPARRVLVVDDNQDAADSLAMVLKMVGHNVLVAHDGPAALDLAENHTPEVIFLDIGLPGMTGLEVARQIRTRP